MPFLLYTGTSVLKSSEITCNPILCAKGVLNFSQLGFYYQLQAVAVPVNDSDLFLETWTKPDDRNPLNIAIPVGGGCIIPCRWLYT